MFEGHSGLVKRPTQQHPHRPTVCVRQHISGPLHMSPEAAALALNPFARYANLCRTALPHTYTNLYLHVFTQQVLNSTQCYNDPDIVA